MKLIFTFLCCSIFAFGQDYSALNIPEDIKKNANVIIREVTEDVSINSVNNIETKESTFFTILKKEGDDFGRIIIPYAKSTKVNDIKGTVYNMLGKEVKSLQNKYSSIVELITNNSPS